LQEFQRGESMIICDLCAKQRIVCKRRLRARNTISVPNAGTRSHKAEGQRQSENLETVFLPASRVIKEREDEEPEPLPGEPPKIWGAMERPH